MRIVLRGLVGLALVLPLLFGISANALAAAPAPAAAVQLVPQQARPDRCHGLSGADLDNCHRQEHEHHHM
jgi:hypothetical protein